MPFIRNLLLIVPVLVIVFAVYFPSLKNGFVNWDDDVYITNNNIVKGLSGNNLKLMFTETVSSNYHPLTLLSLAVDYHFGSDKAYLFHLHNLILHLLNVVLVFLMVLKLGKGKVPLAVFTALVFGIHPMHVESVAWISERKDVLYSFWFLAGLNFYLSDISNRQLKLVLVFSAFVFSALSKSAAVVFPVVLLLFDLYLNGKIKKADVIEKIPLFLVSLIFGIMTLYTQQQTLEGNTMRYLFTEKLSFAFFGLFVYIVKFIVPFGLNNLKMMPYPVPGFYGMFLLAGVPFVLFLLYKLLKKPRNPLYFSFFFYLVTIVLTLQLLTVGNALISERYTYIPYIGVALGVYFLIDSLLSRLRNKTVSYTIITVLFITATGIFSVQAFNRLKIWENPVKLWGDAIQKDPGNYIAYNNLGNYYFKLDSLKISFKNFSEAILLQPTYRTARYNRGLIYYMKKDYNAAVADFDVAIKVNPNDEQAIKYRNLCMIALNKNNPGSLINNRKGVLTNYNGVHANLGETLYGQGKYSEAIEEFKKALTVDKLDLPEVYLNLGLSYMNLKMLKESIPYFDTCLVKTPTDVKAVYNRGAVWYKLGDFDKAMADFSKTVLLDPAKVDAFKYRANIYLKNQDYANAAADFKTILNFEPNNAAILSNRASALYYTRDYKEAYRDATKARQLGYKIDERFYERLKSRAESQ